MSLMALRQISAYCVTLICILGLAAPARAQILEQDSLPRYRRATREPWEAELPRDGARDEDRDLARPPGNLPRPLRPARLAPLTGTAPALPAAAPRPPVIRDDFQVNENAGRCNHNSPKVAVLSDGSSLVVWDDIRNGYSDIYAQRYWANGVALGTNFRVDDDKGIHSQYDPSVAGTADGGFVVSWHDYRNGNADIYAQRYGAAGTALGVNFQVNDYGVSGYQYRPCVAATADSGFVVVWEDMRNGNYDIYAQRYGAAGTVVGTNFRVDDDAGGSGQRYPRVAATADNGFVVTWEDRRNGNYDIYTQRYDADGAALGANYRVDDDTGSSSQYRPSVAATADSGFVVAWYDSRNGNYDIYAQRYDADSTALGANFRVDDDTGGSYQLYPSVAATAEGGFVVTWYDRRDGNYDIYAQRYDLIGTTLGANFRVDDDAGSSTQSGPSVATTAEGGFIVAWQDSRNGSVDIYAQRYGYAGTKVGANFRVNDDAGSSSQYDSSVAATVEGGFVVAWEDYRSGNADIYAQRYDAAGMAVGANFRVDDDEGDSYQWFASVAATAEGGFVVAWEDRRSGNSDIYAKRYGPAGTAVGANFLVDDDPGNNWQWFPSVAAIADGGFVVTWVDGRNGNDDIYAQRYGAAGTVLGANFRVDDDPGNNWQWFPSVAAIADGGFVVAWVDFRNGNADIYAQRYGPAGVMVGSNFRVDDDVGGNWHCNPSVVATAEGGFIVTWDDERNGFADIYAQRYDASGSAVGANIRISDDDGSIDQISPKIAVISDSGYVIAWEEECYPVGTYSYARIFDADLNPIDSSFQVSHAGTGAREDLPDIAVQGDRLMTTWKTNAVPGQGSDIFANILSLDLLPPAAPTGLTATAGEGLAKLSWSANTESDLYHYVVYQSTTAGFTPTDTDSVARVAPPDTCVTLTGLAKVLPITSGSRQWTAPGTTAVSRRR